MIINKNFSLSADIINAGSWHFGAFRGFQLLPVIIGIISMFLWSCSKVSEEYPALKTNLSQGENRYVIYSNKTGAFYITNTHNLNRQAYWGVTKNKEKLLQDYLLFLGDTFLDRSQAEVVVYPNTIIRKYPDYNTVEKVFFADSLTLLNISLETNYSGTISFVPVFSSWNLNRENSDPAHQQFSIGRMNLWLNTSPKVIFSKTAPVLPDSLTFDSEVESGFCYKFESHEGELAISFLWDKKKVPITSELIDNLKHKKAERINGLLKNLPSCNRSDYNEALAWAIVSLDNLIVINDTQTGIWAGLPWFDDFWGRDTFISFAGACLVRGDFTTAKKILKTFASLQCKDENSPDFGRIPNRVNPEEVIYNTADGTPLFIRSIRDYLEYSGDLSFGREIYPVVKKNIDGTLRYHTDKYGFLIHGDSETWMDAVGSEGPWSPRGNRAVEIQALWYQQLITASWLAELADDSINAKKWKRMAFTLKNNFIQHYSSDSKAIDTDHLNPDETRDMKIRPNALIGLFFAGNNFTPDSIRKETLKRTMKFCIYPYGVASLHQLDPDFHWYHLAPGYYPKDAAYHNGTVWQWLSGPAISEMISFNLQDRAWMLTESLIEECLDSAVVGAIAELRDALPRYGKKTRLSGAISQAWSLAEFVRNFYQDYSGIRPLLSKGIVEIRPRVPEAIDKISVPFRVGNNRLVMKWNRSEDGEEVLLSRKHGQQPIKFHFSFATDSLEIRTQKGYELPLGKKLKAHFIKQKGIIKVDGSVAGVSVRPVFTVHSKDEFKFQKPAYDVHLKSTRLPPYPLLSPKIIRLRNPGAKLIASADDPSGDDKGWNGKFTYPLKNYFKPGIFDIRHVEIKSDQAMVYFKVRMSKLVQPGWHPEYGAQLTFVTIAIDADADPRTGKKEIGRNSNYFLPDDFGAERLIYIGGGFIVTDPDGKIICKYLPILRKHAFQDRHSGEISFAVPKKYLPGDPENWKIVVLSGGQDDHGGDDIGDFRMVLPVATEWNGGGNRSGGSNVYDFLFLTK